MPSGNQFQVVLENLAMTIVTGRVVAGDRITLSDVEQHYSISRTLARDVVKALESVRLVSAKRRTGIEVLPASQWNVLDPQVIAWRLASEERISQVASLTELREGIEPVAAGLAARRRTEAQAVRLVELADELTRLGAQGKGRSDEYLKADVAFHSLLLEASGNEMMAAMSGMVTEVLKGRISYDLAPAEPDPAALEDHARIARAVRDGDPDAAQRASRNQLKIIEGEIVAPRE